MLHCGAEYLENEYNQNLDISYWIWNKLIEESKNDDSNFPIINSKKNLMINFSMFLMWVF